MLIIKKLSIKNKFYFGPFREIKSAYMVLNIKHNNMFFTLTDLKGLILGTVSSGFFKLKREKRITPQAAELMVHKLAKCAKLNGIVIINLILKITTLFIVTTVTRVLTFYGLKIDNIVDKISVPHNGCRKKKLRRV